MLRNVGVLYHPKRASAEALAKDVLKALKDLKVSGWLCSAWEEEKAKAQIEGTDMIISVGGDGTILRAARIVVPWPIPVLGINLGRLGFMTELEPKEVFQKLPAFVAGEGWIDERAMLQAVLLSVGGTSESGPWNALNDVVTSRGAASRLIYVETKVNNMPLTTYKADGVILATATGSTGYSLSAGGPILHPEAKEILLTPLLAHLTMATPLVLPPGAVVELRVDTTHQAMLSIDGQIDVMLNGGDSVTIERSPYTTRFLRIQPLNYFYSTLTQRLSNKTQSAS